MHLHIVAWSCFLVTNVDMWRNISNKPLNTRKFLTMEEKSGKARLCQSALHNTFLLGTEQLSCISVWSNQAPESMRKETYVVGHDSRFNKLLSSFSYHILILINSYVLTLLQGSTALSEAITAGKYLGYREEYCHKVLRYKYILHIYKYIIYIVTRCPGSSATSGHLPQASLRWWGTQKMNNSEFRVFCCCITKQ